MTFGSLFAGIGGLDLGLERAGLECRWQVEVDDYATRVLERHWPNVRRWRDIKTFPPDADGQQLEDGGKSETSPWDCDLICAGFPCQDISYAGRGAGLEGQRSGLFWEAMRVVRILGPGYVLLENVAALLTRGLDAVLGTLASLGYDCEWHCLPAAAVGAPHIRDRVFVLANRHNDRTRWRLEQQDCCQEAWDVADSESMGWDAGSGYQGKTRQWWSQSIGSSEEVANSNLQRLPQRQGEDPGRSGAVGWSKPVRSDWWATLARFCRMAYGISKGLHGSGVSHEPMDSEKTGTAGYFDEWEKVPEMREESQTTESASSRLQSATESRGSLPVMPCNSGSRVWISEEKATKELCNLRDAIHAEPQQESHDLLIEVLESIGKTERREAMEGAFTNEELRMVRESIHAAKSKGEDVLSFMWEQAGMGSPWALGEWPGQPRIETGVANRVDRLRCLGNAVVPQVAEFIGQMVMDRASRM